MTRTAAVRLFVDREPLPVAELTSGEATQYAALADGARRRGWLIGRRAMRRALAWAGRPADTAQVTFPHDTVSLSYSGAVAVAAATTGDVAGIGVDLETARPPDPATARIFLHATELELLNEVAPERRPGVLLRWWTVKEALFKADPDNHLGTVRRYALDEPPGRRGTARHPGPWDLQYQSFATDRGCLSVALAFPARSRRTTMSAHDFPEFATKIAPFVSRPPAAVTPDLLIRDLSLDSMTAVEMVVDLQEDYDVLLSREDLTGCATLGELAELIWSRLPGGTGNEPVRA